MKKRFYCLFLFLFFPLFAFQAEAQPNVTPALEAELAGKSGDEFISVNLRLVNQYDDQELYQQSRSIKNREERREYVVEELKEFSRQEQADLLAFLEKMEEAGKVKDIRSFWVGNLVNCKARPEVIQELMSRKDLARLDYNQKREVLLSDEASAGSPVAAQDKLRTDNLTWNVTLVNADQVWDEGFTGEGVIVAVLDTGVNHNHQDLQGNMWTHSDYPNHGYNFVDDNHDNMDNQGHGTHCAGTVAGTGAAGTGTGMAPDASIMNLKVLDGNSESTEADVWEAIQFSIDYGAHIMSLSLGWMHQWNPDRSMWRTTMNNARNAGLIASVASGNEGGWGGQPPPSEVRTPGDVPPPWLHPDQTEEGGTSGVVSVGSTTNSDNLSGFSSKGPVTWQNVYPFNDYDHSPGIGLIRPDIVAPGSDIISLLHNNTSGYTTKSGTSMAAPAVAGVKALLLSKNENLLPEDISQILEESAVEMSESKSNSFGSGRLDAFAAIQATPFMGVHYISHEIDDSAGNDDGHINPGEEIQLNMTFQNPTEDFIEEVTATLSVSSPYITVTDSLLEPGDFPAGEILSFDGAFAFEVADDIPGGHEVEFIVSAHAADDPETKWVSDFSEMAHAPFLQFTDLEIDDSQGGDGDGMLDPGETADLHVTLTNTGQLACEETEVYLVSENDWIMVLTHETQTVAGIEAGESEDFVFEVATLHDTPPESAIELQFSALTGAYAFEQNKEVVVGEAPYYDEGDIPSTFNSSPSTLSNALEPGGMTVNIPENATITGVDVEYSMTSHGGAWMSEQRSFIRCVSEGGETEAEVYEGTANTSGSVDYARTGLDIANDVEGGGDIEFELHAFRTWGGSGSNTQYVYVPDNTWKLILYYEVPAYDVTFRVENQLGQAVEDAVIEVGASSNSTDDAGEAFFELPAGNLFYSATAENHRPIYHEPFDFTPDTDIIEVLMTRVFEVSFSISDVHGNEVPDPVVTFDGETLPPGQHTVGDLEDGTYPYTLAAEGYQTYEGEVELVESDVHLDIEMNPFYTLTFSVSDKWDHEITDAVITIAGDTFEEGIYEFHEIIPGTHTFTVVADHYHDYSDEVEVVDTDEHVEVEMPADGTSTVDLHAGELKVFPNPAGDEVSVSFDNPKQGAITISLMNVTGQLIRTRTVQGSEGQVPVRIDLSDVNPGVYFIQLDNGVTYTRRLIVQ